MHYNANYCPVCGRESAGMCTPCRDGWTAAIRIRERERTTPEKIEFRWPALIGQCPKKQED